jgi:fibronectin type 3 domain-containing protein
MSGRGMRAAAAVLLVAALALGACSTALDVERARELLAGPPREDIPVLTEAGANVLPAPEGVRATSGQLRTVPLVWDALVAGASGYVIERALGPAAPFERIAVVTDPFDTSFVDEGVDLVRKAPQASGTTGLGDGATYHYRLRAYDSARRISASASAVVAATTAAPPAPPEGLRAVSQLPRKVALAWSASDDPLVVAYNVYRSPSATGAFHSVAKREGRHRVTYVDRDLADLRVFYYRVASLNAAGGEGPPSEPVRGVTKADPLPPVALRVEAQRLGRNVLAWDPNVERDVARYRVLRRRNEGAGEVVAEVPAGATRVEDAAVGPDEVVSYVLEAVDADGLASAPSPPLLVISAGYVAQAVADGGAVTLTWRDRADEGFPSVRVEREGLVGRTVLGRESGGRFVDRDVKPGGRYGYVLFYERADGSEAAPSPRIEVAVPGS